MRAKLSVSFVGEEGIDAGGVSREWYQVRGGVLVGGRWWEEGVGGGRRRGSARAALVTHTRGTQSQTRISRSLSLSSNKNTAAATNTKPNIEPPKVMAREIFNPDLALFVAVPDGGNTFQPNPRSVVHNDPARGVNHLDFFKFVGRLVGKALYDGQLIDAYFTRRCVERACAGCAWGVCGVCGGGGSRAQK